MLTVTINTTNSSETSSLLTNQSNLISNILDTITTSISSSYVKNNPICRNVFMLLALSIILISFIGNGITCYLISRKPRMRSAINLFLATIAASDLFSVTLCLPFNWFLLYDSNNVNHTSNFTSINFCDVHAALHLWVLIINAEVLLLISVDRYIIIVRRQESFTSSTAKRIVGVVIFTAFIFSLVSLLSPPGYKHFKGSTECALNYATKTFQKLFVVLHFVVIFLAPSLIIFLVFIGVLRTVKSNCSRVNVLNVPRRKTSRLPIDVRLKTQTFSTIVILFVVFLICRTPYAVCFLVMNLLERFSASTHTCVLWWNYLNSALNPIICAWRIRQFRNECGKFMPKNCWLRRMINKCQRAQKIKPKNVYYCNEAKKCQMNPKNNAL